MHRLDDWVVGGQAWVVVGTLAASLTAYLCSRHVKGTGRQVFQWTAVVAAIPAALTILVWAAFLLVAAVVVGGYALGAVPADLLGAVVFVGLFLAIGLTLRRLFRGVRR